MKKVFENRILNMKRIKYIGLDMDHTLVRYKTKNFEELAFKVTCKNLVELLDYPKSLLNLKFDFNRSIRGLVVDSSGGNLLKSNQFGAIKHTLHGLKEIKYRARKKIFENTQIDLGDPNYQSVDTNFSISFATLFSQLVHLKDNEMSKQLPEYTQIARDILFGLDLAHDNKSLVRVVEKDLDNYILKSAKIVERIKTYRKHGKKIFIVTNSDFEYTKTLLDFAINPYLDGESWTDLFEYVITLAKKPRFFFDDLIFLKINPEDGTMRNFKGPLVPGVYQGGCAKKFTDRLKINPNEILYIGDHIYGDVVRLKKDCAWRTGLVIDQLEEEIQSNTRAEEISKKLGQLLELKVPREKKLDQLISEKIEKGTKANQDQIDSLTKEIVEIDSKMSSLILKRKELYNSHWGEIMRAGIEPSYFAFQVGRFSDIYMARLSDFFNESPRTYYRSRKSIMPHDIQPK